MSAVMQDDRADQILRKTEENKKAKTECILRLRFF